jgi:hypothetical protein
MTTARDMDLLDYFAAKAMAEFIARNTADEWDQEDISVMSYVMAEAMIKERDRDYSKDD